jgi:hypothetical protein
LTTQAERSEHVSKACETAIRDFLNGAAAGRAANEVGFMVATFPGGVAFGVPPLSGPMEIKFRANG